MVNAYIGNLSGLSISVIDTTTNTIIATIDTSADNEPIGVAFTPDGTKAYITNDIGVVLVIDAASNTIIGSPITVGSIPWGIAITPDGSTAYVANESSASVSVIDTATVPPT
jgi:YVTN family beta-propeller protein